MSLISEALKKARQEAARQDAAQRGHPYAVGAVEPPARRPWLPLALGLVAGTLLVLCVFAVAYFSGWGPRREGGEEVRVAEAAPPSPAVEEPPVLVEETPAPIAPSTPPPLPAEAVPPAAEPQLSPPPETPRPAPIIIQPAAPPAETPREVVQPAAPAPVETPAALPEPAPVETPAPAAPAQPAEPKSYVGEVPVPGGGVLRLNGIAYSAASPVAVIDGRVVSRGEIVQGFTVVDIQVNRVRLEGHDTTVFVSLK
jgi:hypothetical protein